MDEWFLCTPPWGAHISRILGICGWRWVAHNLGLFVVTHEQESGLELWWVFLGYLNDDAAGFLLRSLVFWFFLQKFIHSQIDFISFHEFHLDF